MKGLITSEKLYFRLMTDAAFNKTEFTMVYFDAIKNAFVDMALVKWVPRGGDIPWHRVYFFKWKDEVIWDRERRFFCLDKVPKAETESLSSTLSIITLNTLFDVYEETALSTRMPRTRAFLDNCAAHIVCMQEVTPLAEWMLHNPDLAGRTRDRTPPPAGTPLPARLGRFHVTRSSLQPYGVVTLSAVPPVSFVDFEVTPGKWVLCTTFLLDSGNELDVFNVHLTSDARGKGHEARAHQLRALATRRSPGRLCVVAGDFNSGAPSLPHLEALVDVWSAAHPHADGFTFNPTANALAAASSRTQQPARLDRVLVSEGVAPVAARVLAQQPALSDHEPLEVEVEVRFEPDLGSSAAAAAPVAATTALVVIPPLALWPDIQAIRTAHDLAAHRWMPHISVCAHFVPESQFSAVACRLAALHLPAFVVDIDAFAALSHQKSQTLIGQPSLAASAHIHALASAVARATGTPLQLREPHLSLGVFPAVPQSFLKARPSWRFDVAALYMISREDTDYFRVRCAVPLHTPGLPPQLAPPPPTPLAVLRLLAPHTPWVLVGSHALGAPTAESDVDALAWGTAPKRAFLSTLAKTAAQCGLFDAVEYHDTATSASVKLWMADGTEVDAHYLQSHARTLDGEQLAESSDPETLAMVLEPRALLAMAGPRTPLFLECLTWVKEGAQACSVYGQRFGYIGGLSWAILCLHCLLYWEGPSIDTLADFQVAFPLHFKEWDWSRPVRATQRACAPHTPATPADRCMAVQMCTPPHANTARCVTPPTAAAIRAAIACRFDPSASAQPALPYRLTLRVSAFKREALHWFSRSVHRIVVALSRRAGAIRPSTALSHTHTPSGGECMTWHIHLESTCTAVDLVMDELQRKLTTQFYHAGAVLEWKLVTASDV